MARSFFGAAGFAVRGLLVSFRTRRAPAIVSTIIAMSALTVGCAAETSGEDTSEGSASALDTDAYETYAALAESAGATVTTGVTVIGLRGAAFDGSAHTPAFDKAFDETFVVLGADKTVQRFHGSTHPFERKGGAGVPDVNGDGVADVGMIRPGIYEVAGRERTIAGAASFVVNQGGQGKLPGWRDTNHDGLIDDAERATSERKAHVLTDVLFHQGEGGAPPAVGCQVLPASDMARFTKAVGGPRAKFRYVLIDMTNLDATTLPR